MRFLYFLFSCIFLISCSSSKAPEAPVERIFYNTNGEKISSEEFLEIWRAEKNPYTRWDYFENGKRIAKLSSPLYETHGIDYNLFRRNLSQLTGKDFSEHTIFLLEYSYLNDLCISEYRNNWTEKMISDRKQFTDRYRREFKRKSNNVVYLHFFEEGIALSNNPQLEEEYYFQDKNGFLRENIFLHPSLCGSHAIIKPNGEVLVRNGEYAADMMLEHLEPEKWNSIFQK